jgi:hypothetical protein
MLLRGETKTFGKVSQPAELFYRRAPEKRQGQSFYT